MWFGLSGWGPPEPPKPPPKGPRGEDEPLWRLVRDVLLCIAGLAGVFIEALGQAEPRVSLLVLYGTMLGLPVVLRLPRE